jgi:hypothetical protein
VGSCSRQASAEDDIFSCRVNNNPALDIRYERPGDIFGLKSGGRKKIFLHAGIGGCDENRGSAGAKRFRMLAKAGMRIMKNQM